MRGIVKTLYRQSNEPVEVYGFEDGYQGLIYEHYRMMDNRDFSGLLTRGRHVLGTSRTPFKLLDTPEADGINKVEAMKHTYRKLKLDCLFMLGGNGSTKTANRLSEEGLNVIALPKTIDNDTWGTDMTFASPAPSRWHPLHRRDPHHRELPRPRLRDRDHGPQGRLDPAVRGRGRRRRRHPHPRDPLRHGQRPSA